MARDSIFTDDESGALAESESVSVKSIPYQCPFISVDPSGAVGKRACGSWCPLFEVQQINSHTKDTDGSMELIIKTTVNLRCGDGQKTFQFNEPAP